MKAIIVTSGTLTGGVYALDKRLFIGRDEECDIQLMDPAASRKHATVEDNGGKTALLKDLESQNGTTVEEEQVTLRVLEPGDSFEIGHVMFDYLELANSQVESARHGELNLISSDAVEQARVDGISEDDKRRMREIADARTVPPPRKD